MGQFVVKNGLIVSGSANIGGSIYATNLPTVSLPNSYLGYYTSSGEVVAVDDPSIQVLNDGNDRILLVNGTGNSKEVYASSYNYFGIASDYWYQYLGIDAEEGAFTIVSEDPIDSSSTLIISGRQKYISSTYDVAASNTSLVYTDTVANGSIKIDYVVMNGSRSKLRTGTLRATWDSTTVVDNETSVTSIGATKDYVFSWSIAGSNVQLTFENNYTTSPADDAILTFKLSRVVAS